MRFISEFYYGNLIPHERAVLSGSAAEQATSTLTQTEEALKHTLSETQKAKLRPYIEAWSEATAYAEEDAFVAGFRLGASCILDILLDSSKECKPIK